MRWPRTTRGKIALYVSLFYVFFWISFMISPSFKAYVLGVPYLGTALNVFFVVYIVVLLLWIIF